MSAFFCSVRRPEQCFARYVGNHPHANGWRIVKLRGEVLPFCDEHHEVADRAVGYGGEELTHGE